MRSIVLSGFMGTGKTTVGPLVAARLGMPFVDTDHEIERAAGETIAELWRRDGEAAFRSRESSVVEAIFADGTAKVIAFGGGTVLAPRSRRLALDHALIVTLTASAGAIVARTDSLPSRPLLSSGESPLARTRELLALRADAYAESHVTLATDALALPTVIDAVVDLAKREPLLMPLGARSYTIDVCAAEPGRLAAAISVLAPSSIVLVTDSNVQRARGVAIDRSLRDFRGVVTRVTLAPGETHKTLANVSTIWDAALGAAVDRDALVLAYGGGVVGDLAGFAAACLLRGVRLIQVPTTLLAMVDSSVGGKTGFDHPAGKNLVGAFHQPSAVVADLDHLTTLDPRQRAAGLAEVVKIALATDEALLDAVESNAAALARGELDALLPVVRSAIVAKIRIVREDERETGLRALLNVGHTLGHALEAHGGYSHWLHGEAVALGTVAELRATQALGWTPPALVARAERLFASLALPTRANEGELAAAWPFVAQDKKRDRGAVRLPVVTAPGRSRIECVPMGELRDAALRF
jgi:shikimate kinase/3-dehydroquinate synthase